jgi:UDPglucose 6-dehydrogenase/GDP-mannose 6-dehydrogenase
VPPIFEDGLEHLLWKNLGKRFTATCDLAAAVSRAELVLIAVGTPFDGTAIDLSHVERAAREIGAALRPSRGYPVVVVKSTVVPGTTDTRVRSVLEEASGKRAGHDFGLAMNPEFLTEGQAVRDFMEPDRIVLGAFDPRTMDVLETLYAPFHGVPRIHTNPRTAELIKYASNALLATAISFANEMANLCTALGGVDVVDVMAGVHASSYLTVTCAEGARVKAPLTSFLQAGCGFGGSCLPKDVAALAAHGRSLGTDLPLLRAVLEVNAARPDHIVQLVERHCGRLAGLRAGVLGLAFKPDTDDVRQSPAIAVIRVLLDRQVHVKAYDPVAAPEARKVLGDTITYADTLAECLDDVDVAILLTRWKQFESVPELLRSRPSPPLLLDGRRQLDKRAVARYAGVGL